MHADVSNIWYQIWLVYGQQFNFIGLKDSKQAAFFSMNWTTEFLESMHDGEPAPWDLATWVCTTLPCVATTPTIHVILHCKA